jgi:hypothetical protein
LLWNHIAMLVFPGIDIYDAVYVQYEKRAYQGPWDWYDGVRKEDWDFEATTRLW